MACPFCALGLHHFAPPAKVESQCRQRARFVHPDKKNTGDAADEFNLLGATKSLALLYTAAGVMPFSCPGPAKTSIPDPVPIVTTSTTNVNLNFADPASSSNAACQMPFACNRPDPRQSGPFVKVNLNVVSPASGSNSNVNLAGNHHFEAATRCPEPETSGHADQETHPEDSKQEWSKRRWRWIGKCKYCAETDSSVWAYGTGPPRLVGWSQRHTLCPKYPNCTNKW